MEEEFIEEEVVWTIQRPSRKWSRAEFETRFRQAPEKIEYVGGIFVGDRERMMVQGMLLELLGIDKVVQFGKLEDWKAAIADRERRENQ